MPTKEQLEAAMRAAKKVDWSKLDAMTDEDIEAAAEADPDNPPASEEELERAWAVKPLIPPKAAE